MVAKPDFDGCKRRLEWVDHTLRTFDEDFRVWLLENESHPITAEYQPEADIHAFRLGAQPLPARFGIVAANIVHQIRATLDNLVWQLVLANGKEPTPGSRGNQFPIINALKQNRTFRDYTRNSLAGVHPDHVAVIERLQPYQNPEWEAGRHPLALLADLSNTDKHQILKVVSAERPPADPLNIPVVFGGPDGVEVVDSGYLPSERRYPGAIVGWAQFAPSGAHADVYMHAEYWSQLAFADDPDLRVLSVLNTLFAVVDTAFWMFHGNVEGGSPIPAGVTVSPAVIEIMRTAVRAKRTYTF